MLTPRGRRSAVRVDLALDDGTVVSAERLVADAHPNGRRPWRWAEYAAKLEGLTEGRLRGDAREGFLDLAKRLGRLSPEEVRRLNPALEQGSVMPDRPDGRGIF